MRVRCEADEWSPDGRKILSAENVEVIRKTLEEEGPVILEHWHYRGACSPDRLVFDDFEDFLGYIQVQARIGDAFHVWSYAAVCRDDNEIAGGKFPDEDGWVPRGGAY
jgi:hypothetical protein